MRHFRIWGGAKPSVDNKNFIIAWGENRTNPTYWVISPQSSITQLSSPVCTSASIIGSSDYSHGTYKFTIKNNNIEDVIFEGMIGITPEGDPTIYKSVSFFIPGGGSYEYSYISQDITIGGVSAEILNAYFKSGGDNLSSLSPSSNLGQTNAYISTPTVTVKIPAFKPGFSSVKYTYTRPNGSSATVYASSSQQQVTAKSNTRMTIVSTAASGCLCAANNSSTYTATIDISDDVLVVILDAPTAKYARPIQSSHTTQINGITVYFTTNFSTSINCKVARVASNGSHSIIGTESTISIRKGTNTSAFISGPCETTLYFRFYIPAQNGILASDYVWDWWTTEDCSTAT